MLMATDLPEPVVPATSRCGMRARSTITGSPPIVLRGRCRAARAHRESVVGDQLAQPHRFALLVGKLDADDIAPFHNRHAGGDRAHERAISAERPMTRLDLVPGAGSNS